MSISNRLKELRQKSKLSQEEVAEKLGVSRQAISKWESEQSNPDLDNITKLSEIYNTSTDFILKGVEPTVIGFAEKTMATNNKSNSVVNTILKVVGVVGGIAVVTILFIFCLSLLSLMR